MQFTNTSKEMQILIAEPRDILRVGLRNIFVEDPRVSEVYEAATTEQLQQYINSSLLDLVVVHQVLITDLTLLPPGKVVMLVTEPDIRTFINACEHKVRGYLSDQVSMEVLRMMLSPAQESCLLDPMLTPWFVRCLSDEGATEAYEYEYLSPREREIFDLLHQGFDRRAIARQLHISESTLKTHVKNITFKREMAIRARKDSVKKALSLPSGKTTLIGGGT